MAEPGAEATADSGRGSRELTFGLSARQLAAIAFGLAVAVGLMRARRRRGADRPGRPVSAAESVVAVARDPAEVVADLTPPRRRRSPKAASKGSPPKGA